MKLTTGNIAKTLVGTVAAGAMAVSSASPALARNHNEGIGAGEVIAGALVIGGIAAIAAAASDNDRDRYGYRHDDRDYGYDRAGYNRQGSRQAVEACVRAAERDASRWSRGEADVTQVTRINRIRGGYNVHGRIALDDNGRGWGRDRRDRGNHGWDRDRHDTGRFSCQVRYGKVADVDISGIRNRY